MAQEALNEQSGYICFYGKGAENYAPDPGPTICPVRAHAPRISS